jgi:hypothetical protein
MIAHVVNAKVKRFIRQHKSDALVRKDFLTKLDAAVEQIVVDACDAAGKDVTQVAELAGDTPDKVVLDRLICDQRVKETVRKQLGEHVTTAKRFLANLNSLVAAMVLASVFMTEGCYITEVVIGDGVEDAADTVIKQKNAPVPSLAADADPVLVKKALKKSGSTFYWDVSYNAVVGDLTFSGVTTLYAEASPKERFQKWITRTITEFFNTMGVLGEDDEVVVTITTVTPKGK